MQALPPNGVPAAQVLDEIAALRAGDQPTHGGRLFAYVYDPGVADLDELTAAAYALGAPVNGLDPTAFPSLLTMENALVGAASALLGGGAESTVVGNVTSGGTESLILAVKAARDAAAVASPTMVLPGTAHPSFFKAAHYLGVRTVVVPVSASSLRPSAADIAAAITSETVLVACSAPAYPYGLVDPVAAIAEVASDRAVRCHVDACFGGWTLPYLRRLGVPVPPFDFTVPGVTSVSVDLHKYAYSPKGVSVLLHRSDELRAPQYFAYADWPGYTVVNPTVASTRSGGPIAAAYATLRHIGDDGYLALVSSTLDAVRSLASAISMVEGLRLVADAESTVVAFASSDPSLDLFVVADELAARGWHTQPQLACPPGSAVAAEGLPRSVHLTVTASVASQVPSFGADLEAAVATARSLGPVSVDPSLLSYAAGLTPEQLTLDTVAALAGGLGFSLDAGDAPLP
ncbi:MAG TPA: aminotransferase class V-fold PLP-dependent enzyme, partial [Jiangellales bacterium]|nr:aminotransferase class V-fold PLP-dependent enzyme [Jiangellales bacterium]